MEKKREIFLFGAGAVIDWNAPTTPEITNTIRETGFSLKNSNIKITEFIYQRLIKCGYKDSEINFETIINVIEELIVYYSEFNKKSNTPSLLKVFLSENDLSEIFNYSISGTTANWNDIDELNKKLEVLEMEYNLFRGHVAGVSAWESCGLKYGYYEFFKKEITKKARQEERDKIIKMIYDLSN